jgi:hypothetical protein
MGVQGLDDLLYFVRVYPDHAASVFQHARHPVYWYPYAIVGINLTKLSVDLLESKQLQFYLYNYGTDQFPEVYCYLYHRFNLFWTQHEPKLTVMDFEKTMVEFKRLIKLELVQSDVKPLLVLQVEKNTI